MEARFVRAVALAAIAVSLGASHRTANFIVNAPTDEAAQQIAELAEQYRHDLAVEWLGEPLRNWSRPCPITAHVSPSLGAGGATSFVFDKGEVFGWEMEIQGSLERILDSVLPHEVTHTIFASHFRQPLPRWADEGACTTVEHPSERNKQQVMLVDFLKTGRGIAFSKMFRMTEYPRDVLPLYAQGHSLTSFLIAQGGRHKFMDYVGEGLDSNQWVETTQRHYGYSSLAALQQSWLDWVRSGSPLPLDAAASNNVVLASAETTSADTPSAATRSEPPATTSTTAADSAASVYTPGNWQGVAATQATVVAAPASATAPVNQQPADEQATALAAVQPPPHVPMTEPSAPSAAVQDKTSLAVIAVLDDNNGPPWRAGQSDAASPPAFAADSSVRNEPAATADPFAEQYAASTAGTGNAADQNRRILLEWQLPTPGDGPTMPVAASTPPQQPVAIYPGPTPTSVLDARAASGTLWR